MINKKKEVLFYFLLAMASALIISLITNMLLINTYVGREYKIVNDFSNWIIEKYPDEKQKIVSYIKEYDIEKYYSKSNELADYGFDEGTISKQYRSIAVFSPILLLFLLALLLVVTVCYAKRKALLRINELTEYIIKINTGEKASILPETEDVFSPLEDEIYKTVTELKISKEKATEERQNFAESLQNIAHQIKTPLTAISVAAQMQENILPETIKQQLGKIDKLTDELLIISKIDAGALELKKDVIDVYTLLELSAEALECQIKSKNINVTIPNHPDVSFIGDLDWSVEVFINLIKNSIEHTEEGGEIIFSYNKNPLYAEIILLDNGKGFDEKELPYIFHRFYSGGKGKGTGIGLSMAKSIIEMQNGFITASNRLNGGACYMIRFY